MSGGLAGMAIGAGARAIAGKALTSARSDWAAIPPKVKLALLVAAMLVAGILVHRHYADKAIKAAHDAGYAEGAAAEKAAYSSAQASANAAAAKVNTKLRSQSDEEARTIDRSADDVRLRGPGKAICPGAPAAAGAAGGHVAPARPADASVDRVPDSRGSELIALPFADAVSFAKQCDLNRSEALTWRESDQQQAKLAPPPVAPPTPTVAREP